MTRHLPSGEIMSIFDAAMRYAATATPLVIVAGREYGSGSSRDWAAKGALLLGVRAVLAESFERIHRSNLVGMGILPLQFPPGTTRSTLGLDGSEGVTLVGMTELTPGASVEVIFSTPDGRSRAVTTRCRIDTADEVAYHAHGGILNFVLARLLLKV